MSRGPGIWQRRILAALKDPDTDEGLVVINWLAQDHSEGVPSLSARLSAR